MSADVIGTLIPIVAIVMGVLVVIVFQVMEYRRRKDIVEAHHRERLAAIDRGMDIPPLPESFYNPLRRSRGPRYLLTGMIWFFLGGGMIVALGALAGMEVGLLGVIPASVGLAYLLYYFIEGRHERPEQEQAAGTPAPLRQA
jgi:hypothetical protein